MTAEKTQIQTLRRTYPMGTAGPQLMALHPHKGIGPILTAMRIGDQWASLAGRAVLTAPE